MPTDEEISLAAIQLLRIERKYDVHSYTKRLYESGRFRKTVTRYLSKLSQPETALSCAGFGTDFAVQRRSEQLAMFRIAAETCRAFTLGEDLILVTMNLETTRLVSGGRIRREAAATRGKLSATQLLRTKVRKAL